MTQSDSPNEGREEKQRIKEAQNKAAKEWNEAFDYRALRNGVQCGNILMLHLDSVNIRAMEIYTESLRDQLSKERENFNALKESWKRGAELYAHLKFDDQPFTPYQLALQQLEKEREMRKELVQNFKSALRRDTAIKISDVDKLIDMLNKVASELDKNK